MKNQILVKLRQEYPLATDQFLDQRANALLEVCDALECNVREWAQGKPLTDVWLKGFCVRTVMDLGSFGPVGAIIALDAYAKGTIDVCDLMEVRI